MLELANFLCIAFKTSVLFVAVGLLSLVMARRSAALRHLLWLAALALAVLMPLAVLYLPSQALIALPGLPTRLMQAPDPSRALLASAGGAVRAGVTFVALDDVARFPLLNAQVDVPEPPACCKGVTR